MSEEMTNVPILEKHCNSWVVLCRITGEPVLETFNRKVVERINNRKYIVKTALQHLCDLNRGEEN